VERRHHQSRYWILARRSPWNKLRKHRFWDKKNDWSFAGVGAARTFDYFFDLETCGGAATMKSCSPMRSWIITLRFAAIEAAGNWCLDWSVLLVSSLRPSQAGTLDLGGAFRFGNHGRCAQLLPEKRPIPRPLRSLARRRHRRNAAPFLPSKSRR